MVDVPLREKHGGRRFVVAALSRLHRRAFKVSQHFHESLLPLLVHPRPHTVPRPTVPAAPEATREPEKHVHDEITQKHGDRDERRAQRDHQTQRTDQLSQHRRRHRLYQPRRQVHRRRPFFTLPLPERFRLGVAHVHPRRVQVIRRAQRRRRQRRVRARHHRHRLRRSRIPTLIRMQHARQGSIRPLHLARARPARDVEDAIIIALLSQHAGARLRPALRALGVGHHWTSRSFVRFVSFVDASRGARRRIRRIHSFIRVGARPGHDPSLLPTKRMRGVV